MTDQHEQPTFRWEKCADLHNQILNIGWAAVRDRAPNLDSWWAHYFERQNDPQTAGELERRLHPDVIRFLKRARHDYPGSSSSTNLFFYLGKLMDPRSVLDELDETSETLEFQHRFINRYVCLYVLPSCERHGLFLDQKRMEACVFYQNEIYYVGDDKFFTWEPLENILSTYIQMIERKRVLAVAPDFDFCNQLIVPIEKWALYGEFRHPWMLPADDEKIVEDTVAAWDKLLGAIESRLPGFMHGVEPTYYGDEHISVCNAQGFFVEKFLRMARIPNFRFIAPGLRLAYPAELADQPFKSIADAYQRESWDEQWLNWYSNKLYPFLFLRADRNVQNAGPRDSIFDGYPCIPTRALEFSAGLYLTRTYTTARCDGCRLLLPYAVNANKFAKSGDGKVIFAGRKYDGLYQAGRPFISSLSDLRLEVLFENWTRMIDSGFWQVDENGVIGEIEKFKEADTSDKWQLYQIKRTW